MEMGTKQVWVRGNARLTGKPWPRRLIFGKIRLNSAKSGQIGVKKIKKRTAARLARRAKASRRRTGRVHSLDPVRSDAPRSVHSVCSC